VKHFRAPNIGKEVHECIQGQLSSTLGVGRCVLVVGDGSRDGRERTSGQVLLALNSMWVCVGWRPVDESGSPGCSYHVWCFRSVTRHRQFWSMGGKHRSVVLL
jgi:hypothetical protein